MHRESTAQAPEKLSGTGSEAALHFTCRQASVRSIPGPNLFGDHRVDILVTSESLLLYSAALATLLTVPYGEVVLHAISSEQSLYLQLESPDLDTLVPDHEHDMIELFLTPDPNQTSLQEMFDALSTCASMHPDAVTATETTADSWSRDPLGDPEHEWITADSVANPQTEGQFDDASSDWQDAAEADTNGHGPRKWRRTD